MALKAGRVGVNPEDVDFMTGHVKGVNYSAEDTIIGKWVDGKNLHRIIIQSTTPSQPNVTAKISDIINGNDCEIYSITGVVKNTDNTFSPITDNYSESYTSALYIAGDGVYMKVTGYINKPCTIIIIYTLKDTVTLSLEED